MHLTYTPEQERLRQELRDYFAGLMTAEVRAALATADGEYGNGEAYRAGGPAARPRWLAGAVLAHRLRRARRNHARPADLHRRGGHRRRAGPVPDHQHRGADHHAARHGGAEGALPAADSRRGDPLLHRLLRARGGHRPGGAAHPRGTGRGFIRHQRPEDVDEPDPVRGLRVAGLPHRSGGTPAQGPVDPDRAHRRPRLLLDAGAHGRRDDHQRDLLLRRPRARLGPGRRGEPGLVADHQPAQPRAGGAHLGRPDPPGAARGDRLGPGHQAGQRPARHRRRVGPAQPGQGARQVRVPQAGQLAHRGGGRARHSARRRPRPPRSSAPSSPPRPTGC